MHRRSLQTAAVAQSQISQQQQQSSVSSNDNNNNSRSVFYRLSIFRIIMHRLMNHKSWHRLAIEQLHFWVVVALCAACSFVFVPFLLSLCIYGLHSNRSNESESWLDFWVFRFLINLLGYGSVLGPIYLCVFLIRKNDYVTRGPTRGCFPKFLRLLAVGDQQVVDVEVGDDGYREKSYKSGQKLVPNTLPWYLGLLGCFVGLQAAYLTWGVLQELIMTNQYNGEKFKDSQFLVFANRMLAGIIGMLVVSLTTQPPHKAPLYEYTYCSLSNVLSSWCQYEALRFVTFPTQVIAKASKIIPVMLMGRLVNRKTYRKDEYFTSLLISIGTAMFLLSSSSKSDSGLSSVTLSSLSGSALLAGYMLFDSFTSNWQGHLFTQHHLSSLQVMAGTNLISGMLTTAAQLEQGSLPHAIAFTVRNPSFMFHLMLLSFCSVVGQMVIFKCISIYGPVTFTIIMTVRQAIAILLSCLIYGHPVSESAAIGVCVLFIALFLRIYLAQRAKNNR